MPLDSHSYLVAQGWSGKGTGLRQGAITRPLAIPQKKTLAGLGKDRDEAFPFWDHLFAAAAKSIQVKLLSDDDNSDVESNSGPNFKRTTTGILSNRRPVAGTPVSGSNTPDSNDTGAPRLSLLAIAKREAAKRGLYSRFFRGPLLGPDYVNTSDDVCNVTTPVVTKISTSLEETRETLVQDVVMEKKSKKRRKKDDEDEEERRERKKLKKESKEKRKSGAKGEGQRSRQKSATK